MPVILPPLETSGEPSSLKSSELLAVDDRFSGGAYATDRHSGYSQLQRDPRDILKILGNEYVCYLYDPQGGPQSRTAGSPPKILPPEFTAQDPPGAQKTLTEYLLGDERLIDRLLDDAPQEEWVIRPLFGEDEPDLLSALAPAFLLKDLPVME